MERFAAAMITAISIGIITLGALFLTGCGHSHDARLEKFAARIDENPRQALDSLTAMDDRSLGRDDRHYRDFLILKSSDKTYTRHSSDSVIRTLLDYYDKNDPLHPEVLYYAGRVYSDLGDYPAALGFFLQSLDAIPNNRSHRNLKADVLSQTSRLYNRMRMFDEAGKYMELTLEMDRKLGDHVNLAHDLRLAGSMHLRQSQPGIAEKYLLEAKSLNRYMEPRDTVLLRTYLAAAKHANKNPNEALRTIRPLPALADTLSRGVILTHAARIYLDAGIRDTAMMYARQLSQLGHENNRRIGYRIMLSPELRDLVPEDSLAAIILDFYSTMEDYYDENNRQGAIMQNSVYNYNLQMRDKIEALKARDRITIVSLAIICLLLTTAAVMIYVIMHLKRKSDRQLIRLHEGHDELRKLKEESELKNSNLEEQLREARQNEISANEAADKIREELENIRRIDAEAKAMEEKPIPEKKKPASTADKTNEMKNRILEEFKVTYEKGMPDVSETVLKSRVHAKLSAMVERNESLDKDNGLWKDIDRILTRANVNVGRAFKNLTCGKYTPIELHLVQLTKCGFSNSEIGILTGCDKKTVWNRKRALVKRLFGVDPGEISTDGVLRQL